MPPTIVPESPPAASSLGHGKETTDPSGKEKKDSAKPGDKAALDQKVVNNPFVPGGVVNADQMISRKEVLTLLSQQEERLKREGLSTGMSADDISKLVANAGATTTMNSKPDNFMGCVNGVPLYRQNDGTLDLGTKDPEPLRQERCGS